MTYPGIENDPAGGLVNEDMLAVERRRREREAEYGEWVANATIPWGTVNAFTAGMAVPTSTVKRLGWDGMGLVVKRSTKAGREVLERTGTATPEEIERWAAEDKAAAEKATANAEKPAGGARTSTTGGK